MSSILYPSLRCQLFKVSLPIKWFHLDFICGCHTENYSRPHSWIARDYKNDRTSTAPYRPRFHASSWFGTDRQTKSSQPTMSTASSLSQTWILQSRWEHQREKCSFFGESSWSWWVIGTRGYHCRVDSLYLFLKTSWSGIFNSSATIKNFNK